MINKRGQNFDVKKERERMEDKRIDREKKKERERVGDKRRDRERKK